MLIGSMCTGIGGLDQAVAEVFGGRLIWAADPDPDASVVIRERLKVPNYGNIREVNWANVPSVDILTNGFPCQPVSLAGQQKGTGDDRWLFDDIMDAVGDMAAPPGMLVFENVPGLLSNDGGQTMEKVIRRLSASGYVGSWRVVRASEVGAAHQRRRVFIVAANANGQSKREPFDRPHTLADEGHSRQEPRSGNGHLVSDTDHVRGSRSGDSRPRRVGPPHDNLAPADTESQRRQERRAQSTRQQGGPPPTLDRFGEYADAVERWANVLGRPAPAPTEATPRGQRLSPVFVEWLMGYPLGWVTDLGFTRNGEFRLLGNAVVARQAQHAIRQILNDMEAHSG